MGNTVPMEATMAMRTWIGGGNNNAGNPKYWSPRGELQPGDALTIGSGTMQVHGDQLADIGSLTMTGACTLELTNATFGTAITTGQLLYPFTPYDVTINLVGRNTFNLNHVANGSAYVDLAKNAEWVGGFSTSGGIHSPYSNQVVIDGKPHATFINTYSHVSGALNVIDVDVAGTGSFDFWYGHLELGKSVGGGQTMVLHSSDAVQVDQPRTFAGMVQMLGGNDRVSLLGLNNADSYAYQNDMLTIFSHNKAIDALRLDFPNATPFMVEKDATGCVAVVSGADQPVDPGCALLPLHV